MPTIILYYYFEKYKVIKSYKKTYYFFWLLTYGCMSLAFVSGIVIPLANYSDLISKFLSDQLMKMVFFLVFFSFFLLGIERIILGLSGLKDRVLSPALFVP